MAFPYSLGCLTKKKFVKQTNKRILFVGGGLLNSEQRMHGDSGDIVDSDGGGCGGGCDVGGCGRLWW